MVRCSDLPRPVCRNWSCGRDHRYLDREVRQRPPRLREGSVVAVVAPAGPVPPELLDRSVRILKSWGLRVMIGKHVTTRNPDLDYLAGTDAERADDFQRAWCDAEVEAVFCARGGYGCLRMVGLIDFAALATAGPKILVGSSDVTILHEAIGVHLGLSTVFAPMIGTETFHDDPFAAEHLRTTLFEPESVRLLCGPHTYTMVPGRVRGVTVGGTASLLASSLGSAESLVPPPGAIVFLEDVTEEPYRLDRIFTQLIRAGWFSEVAGIALGSWTECGDPDQLNLVLNDVLGSLGLPMIAELGFGHCPNSLTVPLGVPAELNADNGTVRILDAALA